MLLQICFTGEWWHREHVNGFALACTPKWYLRWDVVPKLRSHNSQTCERILLCVRFTCEFKMDWVANDLLQRPQACSFPLCICIWHFIPRYIGESWLLLWLLLLFLSLCCAWSVGLWEKEIYFERLLKQVQGSIEKVCERTWGLN